MGIHPHRGGVDEDLGVGVAGEVFVVVLPLAGHGDHLGRAQLLPCSGGLAMLVAQAWRASELFTGSPIPDGRTEEVLRELTGQVRNVVLIGMPGCGKSAVGRELARRMGRPFADLDKWIEEHTWAAPSSRAAAQAVWLVPPEPSTTTFFPAMSMPVRCARYMRPSRSVLYPMRRPPWFTTVFTAYFDVDASVASHDVQTVLSQLEKEGFFTFLGAYSEVF